jgi:hypothetical protein
MAGEISKIGLFIIYFLSMDNAKLMKSYSMVL